MGSSIDIQSDIRVKRSVQQYLFPFLLRGEKIESFAERLLEEGFIFFDLSDQSQEVMFYGKDRISARSLDHFFMPNIKQILFPEKHKDIEGIRRFSKKMNRQCSLNAPFLKTTFILESVDVFVCPFHIGFINLRVTLPENLSFDDVLYFGDVFRKMEQISEQDELTEVKCGEKTYQTVKDYIFSELIPPLGEYVINAKKEDSYFGSLPFFIDERMYVISYINYNGESISETNLYRTGKLNGYGPDGERFAGAFNPAYISRYCEDKVYDRWSDRTYYVMSEHHFSCITRESGSLEERLASQMYGEHFYSIFLLLYYKIVLLKISHDHAEVDVIKDQYNTELLIVMITKFSSKYYLPTINSTESGTEIYDYAKRILRIDHLYADVKDTLKTLYQNQEKLNDKRMNYLLQILTTYMVISGIFGMNLVIEDWKEGFNISTIMGYAFFEWFSLIVILSGIFVAIALGVFFLKSYFRERKNRKKIMF
ncbi:hypothetical protein [Oceanobacillus rekensis]|uniref:hypothetical protein n=1 Tax=Oceanobacillus rekensis TaxID=937927 RepID=UPI000B453441|nr:hypothetical protein [Oceanobacillus rekensis]